MIKHLKPTDAVERLPFVKKLAAKPLRKTILTAIANAKQKGINPEDLFFKELQINEGPRLKRFQAAARGRIKPYKRRMSHIRVVLETKTTPSEKLKVQSAKSGGEETKPLTSNKK